MRPLQCLRKTSKRKRKKMSQVPGPHPHQIFFSFFISSAVLHELCANGSIANYPQMARLWGTIKENVSSDAGTLCFIEWHEKATSLILQWQTTAKCFSPQAVGLVCRKDVSDTIRRLKGEEEINTRRKNEQNLKRKWLKNWQHTLFQIIIILKAEQQPKINYPKKS